MFCLSLVFALGLAQKPPFKIVHLGNSFSAGNGARRLDGSKDFHSVKGCYRSQSNWGSRFATSLRDIFSVVYINRACLGGVLAQIIEERRMGTIWNLSCPSPEFPDEEIIRDELIKCGRFLRPQIESVDESTDLVLLTIGGNDGKFANIVQYCYALGIRDKLLCRTAINFANSVLDTFANDLTNTLVRIKSEMKPSGKIVLVTYLHLTLKKRFIFGGLGGDLDVTAKIRNLGERADTVQRVAVNNANFVLGDDSVVLFDRTKEVFNTHEPDPTVGRNPDRWLNEFFEGEVPESYHPNALGHQKWGQELSILEAQIDVPDITTEGGNIDLVFVVDSTGSMSGEINAVRTNLKTLVDQLSLESTRR